MTDSEREALLEEFEQGNRDLEFYLDNCDTCGNEEKLFEFISGGGRRRGGRSKPWNVTECRNYDAEMNGVHVEYENNTHKYIRNPASIIFLDNHGDYCFSYDDVKQYLLESREEGFRRLKITNT